VKLRREAQKCGSIRRFGGLFGAQPERRGVCMPAISGWQRKQGGCCGFYRPRLDAFDAAGALRPGVCDFLERCFFRCLLVNCPQIFVMMPVMGLVVWLLSGIGPQGNDDY